MLCRSKNLTCDEYTDVFYLLLTFNLDWLHFWFTSKSLQVLHLLDTQLRLTACGFNDNNFYPIYPHWLKCLFTVSNNDSRWLAYREGCYNVLSVSLVLLMPKFHWWPTNKCETSTKLDGNLQRTFCCYGIYSPFTLCTIRNARRVPQKFRSKRTDRAVAREKIKHLSITVASPRAVWMRF